MRKLKRLGIGGKGGVKRKGKRFWEKENPIFSTCNRTSVLIGSFVRNFHIGFDHDYECH